MTDREMLELAALAAGLVIEYQNGVPCVMKPGGWPFPLPWNPLEDDGDALRLAAKLRISLRMLDCIVDAERGHVLAHEPWGADPYAATRRAIVRAAAAAEIGRTMKGGA